MSVSCAGDGSAPANQGAASASADFARFYCAGMPHLAYTGLSENWLLKECGDMHWNRLAAAYGMDRPAFRDAEGRTAYAAFVALSLSRASLDSVRENDCFRIEQDCAPAGRAQFFSRQTVHSELGEAARIEMLSAFVSRRSGRDNRTAGRADAGGAGIVLPTDRAVESRAQRLDRIARARRKVAARSNAGGNAGTSVFAPCPHNDFNGANFMYFAAFAALADRAEWQCFKPRPLLTTMARRIYYFGNVNVGEDVTVRFISVVRSALGGLSHHCVLARSADDTPIAEVFTRKRAARMAEGE